VPSAIASGIIPPWRANPPLAQLAGVERAGKKSGRAACFFSRSWELASCLASSQRSDDSLINITTVEAAASDEALVLDEVSA